MHILSLFLISPIKINALSLPSPNQLPFRGYNSWFAFDIGLNETNMKSNADALVRLGLAAKGFEYVNLDGGWQASSRNATGFIVPNATKFPSGMKALSDYIHSLGLKFGVYTDRGSSTCDGHPGSKGYEKQDAIIYKEWNADMVKSDSCGGIMDHSGALTQYSLLQNELNNQGLNTSNFIYSMCGWLSWYSIVAITEKIPTTWRIGPDALSWQNVLMNIDATVSAVPYTSIGYYADVDEIMGPSRKRPISLVQTRTQISFIALISSPMLISFDMTNMTNDDPDILPFFNDELLAIHWDTLSIGPHFGRIGGTSMGEDKRPLRTYLTCNSNDPTQQWTFLPSANNTNYIVSVGVPDTCIQAGPSWYGTFNNAQGVWAGACGKNMCGDSECRNQLWIYDNVTGYITTPYWPENNIAAGPYLSLDPVVCIFFF